MCKQESVHRPTRRSQTQGLVVDHRVTQSPELASDMSESHTISRNKHRADEWERSTHQDALPKRSHRALGQPRVCESWNYSGYCFIPLQGMEGQRVSPEGRTKDWGPRGSWSRLAASGLDTLPASVGSPYEGHLGFLSRNEQGSFPSLHPAAFAPSQENHHKI